MKRKEIKYEYIIPKMWEVQDQVVSLKINFYLLQNNPHEQSLELLLEQEEEV